MAGMGDGRPLIGDLGDPFEGSSRIAVVVEMTVLSLCIGFVVGLGISLLLKLMNLGINLLWKTLPAHVGAWWLPLAICPVGGLAIGWWNARFDAAPRPLMEVLAEVRRSGGCHLGNAPASVVAFLLPLVFGGSIGPEAGLTGIIAAAVTWIGNTLRHAGLRAKALADVTVSATISAVFGAPFAGIVAAYGSMPDAEGMPSGLGAPDDANVSDTMDAPSAEDARRFTFRRIAKTVLYTAAAGGAFAGMRLAVRLAGGMSGLPRFDAIQMPLSDGLWAIVCVLAGYVLACVFHASMLMMGRTGKRLGAHPIAKGFICGIVLGILGVCLPYVLFSGEEQSREIIETWRGIPAIVLVLTACFKAFATPLCLNMGWRGGEIFPNIFTGVTCGLAIAALTGIDPMFCITTTTASYVAGVMRKPLLAACLLLLCFPMTGLPWMIPCAFAGAYIPMPGLAPMPSRGKGR